MSRRALAGLWLLVGLVVFNAFFDLYVSRGAREWLQQRAEFELRGGSAPDMDVVMARSIRDGWVMSGIWASIVVAAGWTTVWVRKT